MKDSGRLSGGNFLDSYEPALVNYLVAYVRACRERGLPLGATNVQNELAACNAIYESTYKTLKLGQEDNYEQIIAEANKKLYESGLQTLIDEAQKQLDEYKKSVGK